MLRSIIAVLLVSLVFSITRAQDAVPDVTGQSLPAAAAELNRNGLQLGAVEVIPWQEGAGEVNTVTTQSANGAVVDLGVLRDVNTTIFFDANDLTVIPDLANGEIIYTRRLTLQSADGEEVLPGTRWPPAWPQLRDQQCLQAWSQSRNAPKPIEGCLAYGWFATAEENIGVWTSANTTDEFIVLQDGFQRATCSIDPAAAADTVQSCENIYLGPGVVAPDMTEYVFLRYTRSQLVVVNRSADRWMPTNQMRVPGLGILGDASRFDTDDVIGFVGLLAPDQCLLYQRQGATPDPEADLTAGCDAIAQATLEPDAVFWDTSFSVDGGISDTEAEQRCPAAQGDTPMLCLLPR